MPRGVWYNSRVMKIASFLYNESTGEFTGVTTGGCRVRLNSAAVARMFAGSNANAPGLAAGERAARIEARARRGLAIHPAAAEFYAREYLTGACSGAGAVHHGRREDAAALFPVSPAGVALAILAADATGGALFLAAGEYPAPDFIGLAYPAGDADFIPF